MPKTRSLKGVRRRTRIMRNSASRLGAAKTLMAKRPLLRMACSMGYKTLGLITTHGGSRPACAKLPHIHISTRGPSCAVTTEQTH
jgi:hypothetical protein